MILRPQAVRAVIDGSRVSWNAVHSLRDGAACSDHQEAPMSTQNSGGDPVSARVHSVGDRSGVSAVGPDYIRRPLLPRHPPSKRAVRAVSADKCSRIFLASKP
jgi:hypothetical protein